ncbi:hypothetical protein LAW82_23200, partial [Escherichia coli]|nr:hypothetical protein [Escherichia coli]
LPEELRLSPHRYLATNSPQGPWWLLGWCERVPEADEVLPAPLVRYGWTPRGELAVVYDRSGKQVRSFTYDDKYRGRMVAHR